MHIRSYVTLHILLDENKTNVIIGNTSTEKEKVKRNT